MKTALQQESRAETIFRHTQDMFQKSRTSMETFAMKVVDNYLEFLDAEHRSVEFKEDGDLFRRVATNAQKLRRYMDAGVNARLPVDLEEAWVLALDDPFQTDCIHDLAERYGLMPVRVPTDQSITDLETVGDLGKEFGEALTSVSQMMDDGQFTPDDAAHLDSAVKEINDLIACATGLRARIQYKVAGTLE